MQRSLPALIALILLFSTVGCGLNPEANFEKGTEAYGNRDYKKALKWYRRAAEKGHAEAQYSLGVMYDNGEGVIQDDQTAAKWYRLAAEQGHAGGQHLLGLTGRVLQTTPSRCL